MTAVDPIVISGYARTPMGRFQGALAGFAATKLGSMAIAAALQRASGVEGAVDQVIMGCVLQAGLGQAPARQAALGAGLPFDVGAVTVNKMRGSSMQAAILAHDALLAGSADERRISRDVLNVNGGACGLGRPIGASGARVICDAHFGAFSPRIETAALRACA